MALSSRTFGVEFEVFFEHTNLVNMVYDYPKLFAREITTAGKWFEEDNKENTREVAYGYAKAYGFSEVFDLDYYLAIQRMLNAFGFKDWKLHEDPSIQGPNPIEIVTPILQGSGGINKVVRFCTLFNKYASTNDSTGLHVHVGAADFLTRSSAAKRLTLALFHFKNLEPLFDSLVNASRRNNEFTKPLDAQNEILSRYKQIIKDDARRLDAMLNILTKNDRYKKLNLESLAKHKTLEFRQMHGTLNPAIVKNWIVICLSFVDTVIATESTFFNLLKDLSKVTETPEQENASNEILSKIKEAISSPAMRSYLIRNLELGQPLINNLDFVASKIKNDSKLYFDPGLNAYYYTFSTPIQTIVQAAELNKEFDNNNKILSAVDRIAWRLRNILLLTFPTISAVVRDGKVIFLIRNDTATAQSQKISVSPEEAQPLLTAQKNLATKTGMPKGIPSRAIRSVKQSS